jgi:dTDP-4-dehydrorhamnose reductase
MQRKVLITGASGFLGRYLLKDSPQNTQILAQYFKHPIHSTGDEVQSLELDLTKSPFDKLAEFKPDVIIHAAAQSSIDACESKPEEAWRINFEATEKLVDFAKEMKCRFIYTSTDIVFDGKKGHYSEKDIPNPINVYGQTKLESEKYILENLKNSVVARLALFYGKALNGTPSFTELMLENLRAGKKVNAFTDQYRSPLPVSQLAQAIWELVDSDFRGVIHIGGSERISRYDMAKILCQQFNLPLRLVNPVFSHEVNLMAFRPLDCSLDISLAASLLKTQLIGYTTGLKFAFG